MKHFTATIGMALLLVGKPLGFAQGFVNLNFESATIVTDPSNPYSVYASNAIPGWTAFLDANQLNDVSYNSLALSACGVTILDTNASYFGNQVIRGKYSLVLQAGVYLIIYGTPYDANASISQTGLVPISAVSLLFMAQLWGPGTMQVSMNGQNLSPIVLANGSNYTLYGADISAFAGKMETLTFTAVSIGNTLYNNSLFLDNIQFSSTVVPEPGELALGAFGALLLGLGARFAPTTRHVVAARNGRPPRS